MVRRTTPRHAYRRVLAAVAAVVVLGSLMSVTASAAWRAVLADDVKAHFEQKQEQDAAAVRSELERYESALAAARALVGSPTGTTAAEFEAFTQGLDLPTRYPSLQAINYTAAVPRGELDAFVAARRADGDPTFTVFGGNGRPEHRVITYVSPLGGNGSALGYDTSARLASIGAQDRSRDTGLPALSDRLTLVQDAANPEAGFALTLAVYRPGMPLGTVEERRAAHLGWVNATFRGADFLREVLRRTLGDTVVSLYAGPDVRTADLIATEPPDVDTAALRTDGPLGVVHLDAAGTPWTLQVQALAGDDRETAGPRLVLVGGLGITALLAALLWSRGTAEVRAWRLVERATARLAEANGALETANAALEERNREVAAYAAVQQGFVASASHELRTPLTSILGYLEIVLEGVEDGTSALTPDELACLQVVHRNSQRLLELVGDLLTVSQVEDGSMPLSPTAVAVADLLPPLAENFGPQCARRGLELLVERRVGELTVFADRGRVEQVLTNLVGNAVKFTPPGGRVTVSAAAVLDGDRRAVALTVADTGLGIAPEDLPRVFDRFFRTAESMEQAVPGTGLGLPIARAIVEASGGRIEASSTVGTGSTFTVVLPALAPEPLAAVPAEAGAR